MQRTVYSQFQAWKSKSNRKPLIVRGARQVGKTWLLKEFAAREYDSYAYVNFEAESSLQTLFVQDFDIQRILMGLQVATSVKIEAHKTLIILDEIQEAKRGITSLKYFCENAPEYHVVAAGSLLGIALHEDISFPVGKVEFIDMYPLSFSEFLLALGDEHLVDLLQQNNWNLINTFKHKYIERLKQYYYVGGMPEVVFNFINSKDYESVRNIQKQILRTYEHDFSKHAPTEIVPRLRSVWNCIPAQLAKENRKFVYGLLRKGARAKDFELAIAWLCDCGLLHKVSRISKAALPLKSYEDFSSFKLFIVDVGLLAALSSLDIKTLLDGSRIFEEFKGALTEQYVLQQLVSDERLCLYYWSSDNSDGEVDFVAQYESEIIPIEVKAAENLQAKSLRSFSEKYHLTNAIRTSMSDFRQEIWMCNLPLYAINHITSVIR